MVNKVSSIALKSLQRMLLWRGMILSRRGLAGKQLAVTLDPLIITSRDFVRNSMLEIVANDIIENNVPGAIAELGVFRGDFAKKIHHLFPERTFYLFDTFQGFAQQDIEKEKMAFADSAYDRDFTNTSEALVLSKLGKPQNCILKKGFFPETALGLDEYFAFVSLDADLFDPIYSGLQYFYPRLNQGGYIFIHDFNNIDFPGAKEAVKRFCRENAIAYVPLSDGWGTAVIKKI